MSEQLTVEFWTEVEQSLREVSNLDSACARQKIANYRAQLLKHQVGDIIYHREPADVAAAVANFECE